MISFTLRRIFVMGTLLDITGKMKDINKVRLDLEDLNIDKNSIWLKIMDVVAKLL